MLKNTNKLPVSVRWNGQEITLGEGATIDVRKDFGLSDSEASSLEARLLAKHSGYLEAVGEEGKEAEVIEAPEATPEEATAEAETKPKRIKKTKE